MQGKTSEMTPEAAEGFGLKAGEKDSKQFDACYIRMQALYILLHNKKLFQCKGKDSCLRDIRKRGGMFATMKGIRSARARACLPFSTVNTCYIHKSVVNQREDKRKGNLSISVHIPSTPLLKTYPLTPHLALGLWRRWNVYAG